MPLSQTSKLAQPGEWGVSAAPGVGNQATATKAAGGVGISHICRSITLSFINQGGAAATAVQVFLRDGPSGTGPILWQTIVSVTAVNGVFESLPITGLNITGSANTAMTLEFAAGNPNTNSTVALTGISTT